MAQGIPAFLRCFFWEYDLRQLDIHKHADIIMARIMERGTWQAMVWLYDVYPAEELAKFLTGRGWKMLPPKEVNYWALLSGLPKQSRKLLVRKAAGRDRIWDARSVC